jgi:sugar phosphate permease
MGETLTDNRPGGLEQKWKVLISVMFGIFMIILDATVVNVAFTTLRREFGATLADAQWVLSIYVLSLGVTTPISGFLADRFGIKRVYLFGLGVFVIGSFFCGRGHQRTSGLSLYQRLDDLGMDGDYRLQRICCRRCSIV